MTIVVQQTKHKKATKENKHFAKAAKRRAKKAKQMENFTFKRG